MKANIEELIFNVQYAAEEYIEAFKKAERVLEKAGDSDDPEIEKLSNATYDTHIEIAELVSWKLPVSGKGRKKVSSKK